MGTKGPASPAENVYALGSDLAERERLQRQAAELATHSAALLAKVGVGPGQSAIDLGCGPLGVLHLLSDAVGAAGRVVGVDINPANVAMARSFVEDHGISNVTVIEGDARRTGLEASSFDVVHARTLLVNIPDPEAAVAEMVRLVKPGAWVASMEPDTSVQIYHPPHPAWARLHEIFVAAYVAQGVDPVIARRVPEMFRAAGLVDVGIEARVELYPHGHSRRTIRLELVRSMWPKIIERGIASQQELMDLDSAGRKHLADPNTLVLPGVYFLVWGRKPTT